MRSQSKASSMLVHRRYERMTAGTALRGDAWTKALAGGAPFISLAVVLAAMMCQNPKIASVFGLDLLLWSAVPVALVALAQMFVVGGSEIDLGIGAFAGLINVVSATLLRRRAGHRGYCHSLAHSSRIARSAL